MKNTSWRTAAFIVLAIGITAGLYGAKEEARTVISLVKDALVGRRDFTIVSSGFRLGDPMQMSGIRLYDDRGMNPRQLTNYAYNDRFPSWSADGRAVLFDRQLDFQNVNSGEIMIMKEDGTNIARLTNDSCADEQPHMAPNGTKIAFHKMCFGRDDVYTMNPDGSQPFNVTAGLPNSLKYSDPRWSYDSAKIIFVARWDGGAFNNIVHVYTINPDGTGLTQLTNPPDKADPDPSFSPEKGTPPYRYREMTFNRVPRNFIYQLSTGNVTNDWAIYKTNANYLTAPVLLFQGNGCATPIWRPNGKNIVFICSWLEQGNFRRDIFQINPDGTGFTRLTNSPDFIEGYVEVKSPSRK